METTKDPTHSLHYRLWGPGFLDVSLVPEQQELATPTQQQGTARPQGTTDHQASTEVPTQTMATPSMNLDALASFQADELRKLIESLQGLAESRQGGTTPMQQPPIHALTPAEEEAIRWEQVGTGRIPVTEATHTRSPPTHDHINTQTLAG